MSDTPEVFTLDVIRQDIADPDKAMAEIEFRAVSDGDIEMTVRWGDPPRDRGSYLIPDAATSVFTKMGLALLTAGIERRCQRDPAYRAYMDGDMETWRRLRAEQRTE